MVFVIMCQSSYLCQMSKRKLWILTVALSLALMGLIVIQLFWMDNAIDLKEKQFEQLVNGTLTDIAGEVEKYYTAQQMKEVLEAEEKAREMLDIQWDIQLEGINPPEVFFENESDQKKAVPEIVVKSKNSDSDSDSLISVTINEKEIFQIEEEFMKQEQLVKKVMKELLLEEVAFGERISQKNFNKILDHSFRDRGMDFPYEYSVLDGADSPVYSTEGFEKNTPNYIFRTSLMGDKLKDRATYLYIYFPGQKKFIRGSMGMLGTSTILFTVFMVVAFSFALYVIFRQKKLSDIKSDFVSNMTHELKTPISTISLASQMLSDTTIPQEKKNMDQISRIIQTESKRLGYQVERVLQMSVLDQGHLILKKRPVEMHDLISAVEHNFRLQVENGNGAMEVEYQANQYEVNADRVHMMNVITNLVDNAIKYSGDEPQIHIQTFNKNDFFCLSIADQGIGISKEDQKKVFEKFYRVSTGNVHDVKGFGLGLSYVKLIVEQHNGRIHLSSELGKGSKFEVQFPLNNKKPLA